MNVREVLDAAGISATEASKIFNVHRVTVYQWRRGVEPRSQLVRTVTGRILKLLQKGIDLGRFPLKEVPLHERIHIIRKILRELT